MAKRAKKGKKLSQNKESSSIKPWPDLPQQFNFIEEKSTLLQKISHVGPTKTWITASVQGNANKLENQHYCHNSSSYPMPDINVDDQCNDESDPNIFSISFKKGYYVHRWIRSEPPHHFKCCSHGFLVTVGYAEPWWYYLWDPLVGMVLKINRYNYITPLCYRKLPLWDTKIPFQGAVLCSTPKDEDPNRPLLVVITGISCPAFVFHRPNLIKTKGRYHRWITNQYYLNPDVYKWTKQDYTLVDPHDSTQKLMQFSNAIGFEGKFYALSLQGTLVVIEEINSCPRITGVSSSRAVPSVPSKHFRECLVESNGDILLVLLISGKSMNIVDGVEIFQLRLPRLSWIKVESLGDTTLFVGANCCLSVPGSKVGFRGNCVYFTHRKVDGWWVYDLETGSISPDQLEQ